MPAPGVTKRGGPGGHPEPAQADRRERVIVDDPRAFAEAIRQSEAEARLAQMRVRRAALAALHEEYGDAPIPERIYRAHGLARPRGREGRRAIARREAVLSAALGLQRAGVLDFSAQDLARVIGDRGRDSARRIRHAIAQLVQAGRWPAGTALGRQIGGGGA